MKSMTSQADLWSGPVGQSWVRNALAYGTILEPSGRAALDRLDLGPPQRVPDIGRGTGTTNEATLGRGSPRPGA